MNKYKPDYSMFDSGVPYSTAGNIGVNLIWMTLPSPVYMYQAQVMKFGKIEPNKDQWLVSATRSERQNFTALIERIEECMSRQDSKGAVFYAGQVLEMMGLAVTADDYIAYGLKKHGTEKDYFISEVLANGVAGIEDYVGWCAVERQEDVFDFKLYIDNAVAVKNKGLDYIPFFWIQNLPDWYTSPGSDLVRTKNTLTGQEIDCMSMYARSTMDVIDRFFAAAAGQMGEYIDAVRIGVTCEFGEVGYPSGCSEDFVLPLDAEFGFWVGEQPARDHFAAAMEKKYSTIEALNAAWGTNFRDFDSLDYPAYPSGYTADPAAARYWVDFVAWYLDGLTEQTREIARITKKYFPDKPINLNIGYPFEKICCGHDLTGLIKMTAEENIIIRTPTGWAVPWLYTKRIATANRLYKTPQVSSEPAGNSVGEGQMAETLFKDLTTGVTWHFDYLGNFRMAGGADPADMYSKFNSVYAELKGEYPIVEAVLFFPTAAHYLDNGMAWDNGGTRAENRDMIANFDQGAFPAGLLRYAGQLRNILDYDVVDERLVGDGFLGEYKYLIWPVGKVAEAGTLEKVADWVAGGGTLLINDIESVRTVEGGRGAFGAICAAASDNGVRTFGKGRAIDIDFAGGNIAAGLGDLIGKYPGYLSSKDTGDPILVSEVKDGILVYNRTSENVSRDIAGRDGTVTDVTLEANEFRFIKLS